MTRWSLGGGPLDIARGKQAPALRGAVIAFTLSLLLDLVILDRGIVLEDEGAAMMFASRIARGETLYRDASINLAPGVYEILALVFRLTGESYLAARVVVAIATAAVAALLYLASRRAGAGSAAFIAPWLFLLLRPFAFPAWHMVLYTPFSLALSLGATTLLLGKLRPATVLLAGVLAGGSAVFKQNFGGLVLASGILALLLLRARRRDHLAYVLGFTAMPAFVAMLYALRGALGDLVRWTIVFPLSSHGQVFRVPWPSVLPLLGPDEGFRRGLLYYIPTLLFESLFPGFEGHAVWRETGLVELGLKLAFYLPQVAAPLLLLLPPRGQSRVAARALALSAGLTVTLASHPSNDWTHVAYAMPPAFACAAVLVAGRLRLRIASALLALASVATIAFAVKALGRYDTPIPGVGLRAPEGFVRPLREASRHLADLGAREVVVIPYQPGFFHVSGCENGTRVDLFLPRFLDEAAERDVLAAIDRGCPVVRFSREYGHLLRFDDAYPRLARRLGTLPRKLFRGDFYDVWIIGPAGPRPTR